mgnify:CR=1 FL=1
MATKKVICKYCGASFSREIEPYVKVSNRYAHKECHEKHIEDTAQFRRLTDYIKELYSPMEPDWAMIGTQLKKYKDEGMTYYGMLYTLEFFFKVKGNKVDKDCGVGIIPYQYKKAKAYYTNINNTYTQAAKITATESINIGQKQEVIIIENKVPDKKLINFEY